MKQRKTQWTLTVFCHGLKKRARYWGHHTMRLGTFEGPERPLYTDEMTAQIEKWVRSHMKDWRNITLQFRHETVVDYGGGVEMIECLMHDPRTVAVPVIVERQSRLDRPESEATV